MAMFTIIYFFAFLGIVTCIFFTISFIILLFFLLKADADLTLLFREKFGKKTDCLKEKVVWLTGASSGIGEQLAFNLASAKCRLALSAPTLEELQPVIKQCVELGNLDDKDVIGVPFDISDCSSHDERVKEVIDHFGRIDILVNNAGRSQRAEFQDIEEDVDRALFAINVFGPVNLTRKVVQHFIKRGGGHVVVTSSTAGKLGAPNSATYTGSKHALHGYFESLRTEAHSLDIDVTIVCPGPVSTHLIENAFTETLEKTYGVKSSINERKMTAQRCSHLMGIAIANKLDEVWISLQPILLTHYLAQYTPTFFRTFVIKYFFTKERVTAFREGKR